MPDCFLVSSETFWTRTLEFRTTKFNITVVLVQRTSGYEIFLLLCGKEKEIEMIEDLKVTHGNMRCFRNLCLSSHLLIRIYYSLKFVETEQQELHN